MVRDKHIYKHYYSEKNMTLNNIAELLEENLDSIIHNIGKEYGVSEYADNLSFFDNRLRKWHQYGLLMHSKMVRNAAMYL